MGKSQFTIMLRVSGQGFENINIQANVTSKSTQRKEAKRKHHQRVSNYLESIDCSIEDEKAYFRPRFTTSTLVLQKGENL